MDKFYAMPVVKTLTALNKYNLKQEIFYKKITETSFNSEEATRARLSLRAGHATAVKVSSASKIFFHNFYGTITAGRMGHQHQA